MRNELLIPRACDVVEVAVEAAERPDGDCTLVIRSLGPRGEQVRRMQAPRATVQHAAAAVARHYGLSSDGPSSAGQRRWLAAGPGGHVPPLAG